MTIGEFEAFYKAEYPIVVKFLVLSSGASAEEAEDAAQSAMTDLYRRLKSGKDAIASPAPWVRRAAHNYFVKKRQRERNRLSREVSSGYLPLEAYADSGLTAWEDEQYIEQLLGMLTPTQQAVLRRVLDGMATGEIAEDLGKRGENIRQQLKNSRDRMKLHPQIAPLAARKPQATPQRSARSLVTISGTPQEASQ